MTERQIRPSQYVTTYGSGALIPLSSSRHTIIPDLSRIIGSMNNFPKFNLKKFQVSDPHMEHVLSRMPSMDNKKIRIFRIPSNADLDKGDKTPLFKTIVFPRWSVCNAHPGTPILARLERSSRYVEIRCPSCRQNNTRISKSRSNRGSSVRFVKACSDGHLDDVNWPDEVHKKFDCPGNIFKWDEGGTDINFTVSCYGYYDSNGKFQNTTCGKKTSYSELRHSSDNDLMSCSGLFPESSNRESCSQHAKLILKNSSNLRLVDFIMAVLIPSVPTRLEFLYNHLEPLVNLFDSKPNLTRDELLEYCQSCNEKLPTKYPINTIKNYTPHDIKNALHDILEKLQYTTNSHTSPNLEFYDEHMIKNEYNNLLNAIKDGFPPTQKGELTGLHIEPNDKVVFSNPDFGMRFKVSPIREMLLTRVQRGYSREVPVMTNDGADDEDLPIRLRRGKLILSHYDEPQTDTRWFVGHQLRGEWIFIQLCDDENDDLQSDPFATPNTTKMPSFNAWNKTYHKWANKSLVVRRKTNPRFVWWHTLAHKIINHLAVQSGFSSASIAERIYCYENQNKHTSGILLYTAQPGGDGTMGGLVGMAPHFNNLISSIARDLRTCSNDPICLGRCKSPQRFNGSACHACLFVSETSCESQNKFLDRNIVLETTKL